MRERAAALAEAAWSVAALVALLVAPPFGALGLESSRWLLLRPLAAIAVAAALVARWAARERAARGRPSGVEIAAGCVALAFGVATIFSIDPARSLHGAPPRLAGLLSLLAPLAILVVAAPALARPERRERLVTVLLAGGGALAAWALADAIGLEPMPWSEDGGERVRGAQGNPIFLGAALAMVAPLAIARAARLWNAGERRAVLAPGALALLLGAAALTTGARGPLIGLAGGLTLAAAATAVLAGRRRWLYGIALTALVAGVAVALAAPGDGAAAKLRRVLDPEAGTTAQRLRLWRGTIALVAAEPVRWWTGQGPETLAIALPAHLPLDLPGLFFQPDLFHDRAHNVVLDDLASAGLPGAATAWVLATLALGATLAAAGLGEKRREAIRRHFLTAVGTALSCALLVTLFDRMEWLGVAFGVAPVVAAAIRIGAESRARAAGASWPLASWLPLGFLASLAASQIEGQVGLRTAATATLGALLAAAFARGVEVAAPAAGKSRERRVRTESPPPVGEPAAVWVALVAATAALSTWTPAGAHGAPRALALVAAIAAAAALPAPRPLAALLRGLLAAAPYLFVHGLLVASGAGPLPRLALFGAGLVAALAWAAVALTPPARAAAATAARRPLVLAVASLAVALVGWSSAERLVAGVELGRGREELAAGRAEAARQSFAAASRRAPELQEPVLWGARALARIAAGQSAADERDATFRRALEELDRLASRHPRAAGPLFEAALAAAQWSASSIDPAAASERLGWALERFERAGAREPTSAPILRAWGAALADAGRLDQAISRLRRATELAPRALEGHLLLARALLAGGEVAAAGEAAAAALALDRTRALQIVGGLARARPDDVDAQLDAALLLATAGESEAALAAVAAARAIAGPGDRPQVERVAAALAANR